MLVEKNIQFPKTHDLGVLLDLLLKISPDLEMFCDGMNILTDYAVVFRYPGESATKEQSRESFLKCIEMREAIRNKLKLT
jgi:HEPN domain-containing protein